MSRGFYTVSKAFLNRQEKIGIFGIFRACWAALFAKSGKSDRPAALSSLTLGATEHMTPVCPREIRPKKRSLCADFSFRWLERCKGHTHKGHREKYWKSEFQGVSIVFSGYFQGILRVVFRVFFPMPFPGMPFGSFQPGVRQWRWNKRLKDAQRGLSRSGHPDISFPKTRSRQQKSLRECQMPL